MRGAGLPGAVDSVLAVGATDARAKPVESGNWGGLYGIQGILALGVDIFDPSFELGAGSVSGTAPGQPS
jgi:hypothetical protein